MEPEYGSVQRIRSIRSSTPVFLSVDNNLAAVVDRQIKSRSVHAIPCKTSRKQFMSPIRISLEVVK